MLKLYTHCISEKILGRKNFCRTVILRFFGLLKIFYSTVFVKNTKIIREKKNYSLSATGPLVSTTLSTILVVILEVSRDCIWVDVVAGNWGFVGEQLSSDNSAETIWYWAGVLQDVDAILKHEVGKDE